ncbi:MAG: polymer-forming cytoskeletal protein [Candidatus Eremiobacteraeota bacterium]|nr:polymer-forming cytoskeletal protein [Candidatus Eremiobacteraeota bacterium]
MMALRILAAFFVVLALTCGAALAAKSINHGGSYFGSVVVEPGQTVEGDLNVIFGNVTVDGSVDGDVNVVGGNVYERPGGLITGHVNAVGGEVVSDVVPWMPAPETRAPFESDANVLLRLAWDVVVLLIFLIFPVRTRMALDRLERHPGLSLASGTLGFVAILPVAILLALSVLLIPLIPIEFVAVIGGVCIGTAALSLLVGRRLCELINPSQTPAPLTALVVGLALLTAAELVPVIGTMVMLLVALIGLGAALLTLMSEQSFAGVTRNPVGVAMAPVLKKSSPDRPAGSG